MKTYKNKSILSKFKKQKLCFHIDECEQMDYPYSDIGVDSFSVNMFLDMLKELESDENNKALVILKQLLILDFNASHKLLSENIDDLFKIVSLIFNKQTSYNALLFLGILTESTDMFSDLIGTEQFFSHLLNNFELFINDINLMNLLILTLTNLFVDSKSIISNCVKTHFLDSILEIDLKFSEFNKLLYIIVTSDNLSNEIILTIIKHFNSQIIKNDVNLKYALNTFIFFLKDLNYREEIIHLILTYNLCSTLVKLINTKYAIYSLEILKLSVILSEKMILQLIAYDLIKTITDYLKDSNEDVLYYLIQLITSFLYSLQNSEFYINYTNSISNIYEYNFHDLFLNSSFQIKTVMLQMFCVLFVDIKIDLLNNYISDEFIESVLEFASNQTNKISLYNMLVILITRLSKEKEILTNKILQKLYYSNIIDEIKNDSQSLNQDLAFSSRFLLNQIDCLNLF